MRLKILFECSSRSFKLAAARLTAAFGKGKSPASVEKSGFGFESEFIAAGQFDATGSGFA
jgi:hypothetical protein